MIRLYSAGDARVLAAKLAEVYGDRPADPLTQEWLAVPSDGMRRWLNLELARHLGASRPGGGDGIAANIRRAFPGGLRDTVLAAGRGDPSTDPWSVERMAWALLAAVDADRPGSAPDSALDPIRSVPAGSSRYATARRIADLFDRYHLHRPAMVRSWAAGADVDGVGRPLPTHHEWQARLWRTVRDRIGTASPPEALPGLLRRLADGDLEVDLPERLVFFGFSVLPGSDFLAQAGAAAVHRDVHLFLFEAWPFDPRRVAATTAAGSAERLRPSDLAAVSVAHPLLRSWGKLTVETGVLLAEGTPNEAGTERLGDPPGRSPTGTLLGRLQHAIRTDDVSVGSGGFDPSDRSVQFHACFGPLRQVEVARDALLHLLAADPDLTEDDIVVLCPDLERFRPLLEAGFGPPADEAFSADREGGTDRRTTVPRLRYRIVDRSIRSVNPVLGAFGALLELTEGRMEATAVLDFLSLAPVRTRLRFDDEDLALVADWVSATNLAWGIDPPHRARFGVPDTITANTWQATLDQLVVGATVQDDERALSVGGVAPHPVEGSSTEVLGRLAGALDQLRAVADASTGSATIAEWVALLRRAAGALLAAERGSSWQTDALDRLFADVLADASGDGLPSAVEVEFADIRRIVDHRVSEIVARPDFFRGGVMCTSLTPLRWIPFRVVCLLGMDQASFRSTLASGDDLVAAAPRLGDPDARGEVREALLEAVLAADDHLVVVRDGHDVRTRKPEARSVVASELFDAVVATVGPDWREELRSVLETAHPLHAYDERSLTPDQLGQPGPWSFDRSALEGARARRSRSNAPVPFLSSPLEGDERPVIELADLHDFFARPSGTFLTRRLGVVLPRSEPATTDHLPVSLTALERWGVGARLLAARLDGVDAAHVREIERARGSLPPGALEHAAFSDIEQTVDALANVARGRGLTAGAPEPFEVDLVLDDGTRVVGVVQLRLTTGARGCAQVSYNRIKRKHHLSGWLDLMALCGSDAQTEWRSLAVGRSAIPSSKYGLLELIPSAAPDQRFASARTALGVAVDCFRRGMCEPLPLFPEFSYDIFCDPTNRTHWKTTSEVPYDGDDSAVRATLGDLGFEELMALPARSDDPPGPGGRAERYAHYVWETVEATSTVRLRSGIEVRQSAEDPAEEACT